MTKDELVGYVTKLNMKFKPFILTYDALLGGVTLTYVCSKTKTPGANDTKKEILAMLVVLIEDVITASIDTLGGEGEQLRQRIKEVLK